MEQKTFIKVTCSILTISDTRNLDTDTSGQLIHSALETAGQRLFRGLSCLMMLRSLSKK